MVKKLSRLDCQYTILIIIFTSVLDDHEHHNNKTTG